MAEEPKVVETKSGNNDLLVKAVVLWLLAPIGYLFYMNDTDPYVKFMAKQSLYWGIFLIVIYVVGTAVTFMCATPFLMLLQLGVVVYMIVKMKDGVKVKLPVIGNMADK